MKKEKLQDPNKDLLLDYEPVELPKEDQHYFELLILFISCMLAAYTLFAIDIDTTKFADLLTWNMLISALIYAVPAFIASAFLFEKLVDSYSNKKSILLSLGVSIPLIFMLLMWFLSK